MAYGKLRYTHYTKKLYDYYLANNPGELENFDPEDEAYYHKTVILSKAYYD